MYPLFNLKEKPKSNIDPSNIGPQQKKARYEPSYPLKRKVGDNVEALWEDDGIYYNAHITKVHADGYCDVVFEDDYYSADRLSPYQLQDRKGNEVGSIVPPTKEVSSKKTRSEVDVFLIDGSDKNEKKRKEVFDIYALHSRIPSDCGIKVTTGLLGKKELFCTFCSHTVTAISSSVTSHLKSNKHTENKTKSSKVL